LSARFAVFAVAAGIDLQPGQWIRGVAQEPDRGVDERVQAGQIAFPLFPT
jgi:hypothetical protein